MTTRGRRLLHAVLRLLDTLADGAITVVDEGGTSTRGRGAEPVRVVVHDARTYGRTLRSGSVGLGEAYADGWWDCDDLAEFLRIAYRGVARTHRLLDPLHRAVSPIVDPIARRRPNDKARDARDVRAHYDVGNDFFERILDETMMYSCAVFDVPDASLADASRNKLDRLARMIALQPGDRVVEIGTGWGGFAVHAATHYGCHVTTTTVSDAQYSYARDRVRAAGLESSITVLHTDYRDLRGSFDKAIAIEMIEAVDWRDYDDFFGVCRRLVGDVGMLGMQAITVPDESFDRAKRTNNFIKAAIFPGSCLASVGALTAAARHHGFALARSEEIGAHYAETLRRWRANLDEARGDLSAFGLDARFGRLWDFYFAACEAGFDERYVRDVQLLYTGPAWQPEAQRPARERAHA